MWKYNTMQSIQFNYLLSAEYSYKSIRSLLKRALFVHKLWWWTYSIYIIQFSWARNKILFFRSGFLFCDAGILHRLRDIYSFFFFFFLRIFLCGLLWVYHSWWPIRVRGLQWVDHSTLITTAAALQAHILGGVTILW